MLESNAPMPLSMLFQLCSTVASSLTFKVVPITFLDVPGIV